MKRKLWCLFQNLWFQTCWMHTVYYIYNYALIVSSAFWIAKRECEQLISKTLIYCFNIDPLFPSAGTMLFWSLKKTLCDMIILFSYLILLLFTWHLITDHIFSHGIPYCYFLFLLFSKICCRFSFRSFINSLISSHFVNCLMDLNLFPFFLPSPLLSLFRLSFFWMIVIRPRK